MLLIMLKYVCHLQKSLDSLKSSISFSLLIVGFQQWFFFCVNSLSFQKCSRKRLFLYLEQPGLTDSRTVSTTSL